MLLDEVKSHYGKLKLLIDGEWVESRSTQIQQDTNPATDEVIAEFPVATQEETIKAVEAAQKGFQTWRNVSIRDRAYMLFTMHGKFRQHFEEMCRTLTQDHGRTIDEARGSV
ncbi:MAG: aldehyde dehydrogenase family protein, partial [Desulfobacterales bacterium]|nr:aldehyde dehydrogenase family protein [Desulfobacterales bacterium]